MRSFFLRRPSNLNVMQGLFLTFRFVLILLSVAGNTDAITLPAEATRIDLNSKVLYLEDPGGQMSIAEVRDPAAQQRFRQWTEPGALNFGLTRSAYWLKVTLKNSGASPVLRVLEIPYTGLDYIDFYPPDASPVRTGSARPFDSRPLEHRHFIFPFHLPTQEKDFYFRIASRYTLTVDLNAWQPQAFFVSQQKSLAMQAMYFGELLALLLYNAFLFISLRDRRFLYYVLFTASLGFGIFAGNGFGRELLWRDAKEFDVVSQTFFVCLAMVFANLFSRQIIQVPKIAPRLAQLMRWSIFVLVAVASLLLLSVAIPLQTQPLYEIVGFAGIFLCALILLATWHGIRQRVPGARLFMLAWGLLMIGGIIASLRMFDLVPTNSFTSYSLQIMSAAELLLLAFMLAGLIRAERKAAEDAQRHALAVNEKLLHVTRQSESRLESMVRDRTLDLNMALEQQKRMLAQHFRFGELISHEFRNPLSIIESQASVLKKQKIRSEVDMNSRLDDIKAAAARLKKLFEQWIQNDRMMQPDLSLQLATIDCRAFLQDLLEKNLLLAKEHSIALELEPAVGKLSFDKDLLEIALLNLIDNASKYSPPGSSITVSVSKVPAHVRFSVRDQGPGISAENRNRVFEDYVRLETSGKAGLGLGLPLVKKIAEMHGAQIDLSSEPGEGCTFSISVPDDLARRREPHAAVLPA